MTSLAEQDEQQLGGRWSVLVRQKRDHVRLDRLLHELPSEPGTTQDEVLHRIHRLVFPHAFAEESVLWPVIRKVLPDGEALTRQVEQEHQEVNELVTALESGDLVPEERRATLERLVEVLREDVRDEEDALLPALQQHLGPSRLRQLGVAWELVRRTAPTRPHPVVSRRPPGNALAALPLTVIDRSRDVVDMTARRAPAAARPVLRRMGAGLGAAASVVEQAAPFRRGESSTTHRDRGGGPDGTPTAL